MARSGRMFEIIQILRSAKMPVTADDLAAALEVNKRTVYRDIATLQSMRVPVEGAAGVGYIMRSGYDLPPLMFTSEEIEAIVVGLSLIGRTGDTALETAGRRAGEKIAGVLPAQADEINPARLFVSRWNEVPASPVDFRLVRRAIREEQKLKLNYSDGEGRDTERVICPLALVYYVDGIVLAAFCELRQDFRHFRNDRRKICTPVGESFKGLGAQLQKAWDERHPPFPGTTAP